MIFSPSKLSPEKKRIHVFCSEFYGDSNATIHFAISSIVRREIARMWTQFFGLFWTFFCGSSLFFDPNFLHLGAFCPQNAESNLKSLYQWKNMTKVEIRGKIFTHIWNLHFFGFFWIISICHLCRLFSLRVFNLQGMTIPPIDRKFYAD